jgi:hypothetical protein
MLGETAIACGTTRIDNAKTREMRGKVNFRFIEMGAWQQDSAEAAIFGV